MRRPKGIQCHTCAPSEYRQTPNMTGDYDFDESMMHVRNKDLEGKLKNYLVKGRHSYSNTIRNDYNSYDVQEY